METEKSLTDTLVRSAAFEWLREQVRLHGDVLPRNILGYGFVFQDNRVPLVGPQGIFKPKIMDFPLSITTIPHGPYDDGYSKEGLLLYHYRGTNPSHPDNRGLREVMSRRLPLVYFHRIIEGKYLSVWPVFIVGDVPSKLTFKVEVDDARSVGFNFNPTWDGMPAADNIADVRRSYITATVRYRIHQRLFRERVLRAYQEQCTLCRFRHEELLDAAHIIPDGEQDGEPIVPNGLALCKFHHVAYDRQFLGIRPDYTIEVRPDILREEDGPMLLHGLKGLHDKKIILPKVVSERPSPALLERRYEKYKLACP